jgi:glycosyltransferase involved in cell wall biosynthesis
MNTRSEEKTVFFWQSMVSPHTHDLYQSLSRIPGVNVVVVSQEATSVNRKLLGWNVTSHALYRHIIGPNSEELGFLLNTCPAHSYHIVQGVHCALLRAVLKYFIKSNTPYSLYLEPRDFEGFLGTLRRIHSILFQISYYKKSSVIFGIGAHFSFWLSLIGIDKSKHYQFGYFIESASSRAALIPAYSPNSKKIVYVGRFVPEKGIQSILRAASLLDDSYSIDFIGTGPLRHKIFQSSQSLNFKCSIGLSAPLPNSRLRSILANYDVLLLPSTSLDDGWGVVVNEALLEGLYVLVSSKVGSSICINKEFLGAVMESPCHNAIVHELHKFYNSNYVLPDHRSQRRAWANHYLSPSRAAKNMIARLDGDRRMSSFLVP